METVLTTKYHLPYAHPNLIPRSHLIHKLDEDLWRMEGACFLRRLTLVAAPAGYGKTTLLCEWVKHLGLPAAWISYETTDNDPYRFLQYLVASLQTIQPGFGEVVLASLRSQQSTNSGERMIPAMAALVNEIATFQQPFLLVFDDYHTIEAKEIHLAVKFLLDHLPENLSLAIATRADPPLPLSRLRTLRQMAEVRTDDLRFSDSEAETFLKQIMHVDLTNSEVATLAAYTEGWIAGLQMAALALQGSANTTELMQSFSGRERHVIDYLFEEVLSHLPQTVQAFLIQTSILNRMTGPLCDAVLGEQAAGVSPLVRLPFSPPGSGQQMLEYLERSNLFLVPLDHERCYYRYHHLFLDLLRHQLQRNSPEQIPALHARAAEWFEAQGSVPDALDHWLAVRNYPKATGLIEKNGYRFINQGNIDQFLAWLRQFPQDLLFLNVWLCIFYSWAVIFTGRTSEGEIYISAAEKNLGPMAELTIPALLEQSGHIAAVRQYLAALNQDVAGILHHADLALKYLPEKDLSIRSIVTFLLGSGRLLASQFDLAEAAFIETIRLGKGAGNTLITVNALCALANLIRTRGELHRAYQVYQEAAGLAVNERGVSLPVCAEVLVGRARLSYEWNDLKAAEEDILTACNDLKLYANFDLDVDCNLILSRLRFVQGNLAAAEELLREGAQSDRQVSLRPGVALLASQINFFQAKGDLECVMQLVNRRDWSLENKPLYAWAEAFLAYGNFLCRQKRYDEAQRLLAECLEKLQALGLGSLVIKVLILRAIVFDSQGQHALALQAIARAVSLGEAEGFIRVFVDEGEVVRRLLVDCRAGIAKRTASDDPTRHRLMIYLDALLSAFPELAPQEIRKTSTKNLDQDELIEPLTIRELEVIRLIADGLSNKEIAERLVVSIGTVKAHTTNIYRKLDVLGRTKALAKAREFHIL